MSYCLNPSCLNPSNPNQVEFCISCGTKILLNERYRATELLGAGGMGRNFLAVDECTPKKKSCVIKQFFPIAQVTNHPTAFQKAVELFHREAAMLDELGDQSTQIPRLLAHIEQDSRLYLVQEFIEGQNLLKKLEQEQIMSESQIIQLLSELLPVLQFIHEQGVVHRDIKPTNIMWRPSKPPVLIDFGISKELSCTVMAIGTTIGTVGYTPLEQMTYGESYPASDIYALGATCIHLLTNIFPGLLYNPQNKCWIWRSVMASKGIVISKHLEKILDKMLQEDIQQRYQSAKEVLRDLYPLSLALKKNYHIQDHINHNQKDLSQKELLHKFLGNLHQDVLALPSIVQKHLSDETNKLKISLIAGAVVVLGFGINRYFQATSEPTDENVSVAATPTVTPTLEPSPEPTPTALATPSADCYSASTCLEKGIALHQEKMYDAARVYYDKAIIYDYSNPIIYYNRGLIHAEVGDKQGALEDFNKAIELKPSYKRAYKNRAIVRADLGDKAGASEDFSQVIILEPQNASAYYDLGIFNENIGNKQEALQNCNQAIKLNKKYADAYYSRGIIQQQLNQNQEAMKDFKTAAKLYEQQGKDAEKQDALNKIEKLEVKLDKSTIIKSNQY
ncbi:hypothetical protein NIES2101_17855 [Calothrix sp. HK-06]|nr:hypothetical protein NIES2101_17855 [Calothrix sp. HK-06]